MNNIALAVCLKEIKQILPKNTYNQTIILILADADADVEMSTSISYKIMLHMKRCLARMQKLHLHFSGS